MDCPRLPRRPRPPVACLALAAVAVVTLGGRWPLAGLAVPRIQGSDKIGDHGDD